MGGREKERRIRQAEGSVLPADGVLDWKPELRVWVC